MARKRGTDGDRTVKRKVDVAAAFDVDESAGKAAPRAVVPLDAIPVLARTRAEMPWDHLDQLATQMLLRVDGQARAMDILDGNAGTPAECLQVLADLARRGLVHILAPGAGDGAVPLEIDLSKL
jgi:hypothetical protein